VEKKTTFISRSKHPRFRIGTGKHFSSYFAILIVVLLFHSVVNFYTLNKSKIVRRYDEATYLSISVEFHQLLKDREYKDALLYALRLEGPRHPKFFFLVQSLILTLTDNISKEDVDLMIFLTGILFFSILLISVYKIGVLLYGEEIGALAAIVLSFSPIIFNYTRISILDLPITAMLSLSFLSLLKTNKFTSLFFSILTGILLALAQFTKETAIIFILPVFSYYAFISLHSRAERKKTIKCFSITIIVFLSLLSLVYFYPANRDAFKTYWGKSFLLNNVSDLFYYFKAAVPLYFGIILSIPLIPLLLSYLYRIKRSNLFLSTWLIFPFLLFSLSPNKEPRFLLPLLPPLFLLLIAEIDNLFPHLRKIYIAVIVFVSLFQFTLLNFIPYRIPYPSELEFGLLSVRNDTNFYLVEKLIDIFEKEKENVSSAGEKKVIFTFDLGIQGALDYEFKVKKLPFFVDCPQQRDTIDAPPPGTVDWQVYLLTADYVVDKTGDLGRRGYLEDIGGEFKKSLINNLEMFTKIGSFKTREGDYVSVYKKIRIIEFIPLGRKVGAGPRDFILYNNPSIVKE